MQYEPALAEAKRNPQAYACIGVTFVGGFVGLFFAIFLTELSLRLIVGGIGVLIFIAGVIGHWYFKKKEKQGSFKASRLARRTIGMAFTFVGISALCLSVPALISGNYLLPIGSAVFLLSIFPFVRALQRSDDKTG